MHPLHSVTFSLGVSVSPPVNLAIDAEPDQAILLHGRTSWLAFPALSRCRIFNTWGMSTTEVAPPDHLVKPWCD